MTSPAPRVRLAFGALLLVLLLASLGFALSLLVRDVPLRKSTGEAASAPAKSLQMSQAKPARSRPA